jgi:hypothetical protein
VNSYGSGSSILLVKDTLSARTSGTITGLKNADGYFVTGLCLLKGNNEGEKWFCE